MLDSSGSVLSAKRTAPHWQPPVRRVLVPSDIMSSKIQGLHGLAWHSKMAFEIHALVEDTNHFDSGRDDAKKHHMRTDTVFPIARTDIVTRASSEGIIRYDRERAVEFPDVTISLVDT